MNELYKAFLAAAGQQSADIGEVRYVLADLIAEMGVVQQSTTTATQSAKNSSQSQSAAQGGDNPLVTVLKSGFGVAPLIGGLISLFSGGSDEPAPLVKYAMPASVNFQAAEVDGGLTTVGYDQSGMARGYRTNMTGTDAEGAWGRAPAYPAVASSGAAQVTVNVQAMDARSFLDRSGDIAAAVREAMLNLNSINDVVNDL